MYNFGHLKICYDGLSWFRNYSCLLTWTDLIATNSSRPGLQRETEFPALCGASNSTLLNKFVQCPAYLVICLTSTTGGPRISRFLVPKGYHEIRGSQILKPSLVLKSQIGSKIFLKSPFLAIFHEIIRDIFTYSSSYSWKFWSRC